MIKKEKHLYPYPYSDLSEEAIQRLKDTYYNIPKGKAVIKQNPLCYGLIDSKDTMIDPQPDPLVKGAYYDKARF